jgi:hypothetical protein
MLWTYILQQKKRAKSQKEEFCLTPSHIFELAAQFAICLNHAIAKQSAFYEALLFKIVKAKREGKPMGKKAIATIASTLTTCLLLLAASKSTAASGPALSLNGVSAYASAPDNSSLDLGTTDGQGFTIEAWFYVPDLNGEGLQTLIYKQSAYALFINFHTSRPDQMFFRLWSLALPAPGYVTLYANPSDLSVGWHHAAAVFDNQPGGGNDAGAVYLDGNRIGLGTGLNFNPGIGNSSSPLYIGAYSGVNPFNGWIDEARLSDLVRYSGTSYTVPSTPFAVDSETRAVWHFDETPGSTTFADASANGNTLTGSNGAQTGTPPPRARPSSRSRHKASRWRKATCRTDVRSRFPQRPRGGSCLPHYHLSWSCTQHASLSLEDRDEQTHIIRKPIAATTLNRVSPNSTSHEASEMKHPVL